LFYVKHSDFDIVVVGGGHAGVEAALAGSRMNKRVALVTMEKSKLALMSCNPAIGGLGKSHIVKEIDCLGGVMGKAIDATGIQFRQLNKSRGAAVWSTRAQADRVKYNEWICHFVSADNNVEIIEAIAGAILVENGKIAGIETEDGEKILGKAVIICSGTFLGGLIHIGEKQTVAGRRGEKAAYKLSDSLRQSGLELGRLKTGTPPRLDSRTIDFSQCQVQPGDLPIPYFSYTTISYDISQVACHLTYTTDKTKEIILENIHRSPMFSGQIKSRGPRYCPSIEDKIYRFKDKMRHQIFLEPEGNGTDEVYPNGFSTSLPEDVQLQAIRTIIGLEQVNITQPGYAIEYDYCPTDQIKASLECKKIKGLFLAGQINGTSGYEEAAGQGLMAGINAVLQIENEPSFILDRSEAYIGVMIDDLVTHSTTEPYRMFTSRAEYRLGIREDNARDRLFRYSEKYSLIPKGDLRSFEVIKDNTESLIRELKKNHIPVSRLDGLSKYFTRRDAISMADLLKVPGVTPDDVIPFIEVIWKDSIDFREVLERAAVAIRYDGYIKKQEREVDKFHKLESQLIPTEFPFEKLTGLRNDALEKFIKYRPISLGQAGRIEGVTTGDLAALSIHIRKFLDKKGR
jgi:tRNA uridine 5-carboxymethylaminomethyl modification enzyme